MGPLEILGCRRRTGDSLSSLPNPRCAAPCARRLVESALEAARGLKAVRGSLDTPSSPCLPPCAQARSPADSCLVPGVRARESRSQETGKTPVSGRFRTASPGAPSFSLESLRWVSQKAPENLVRVDEGSRCPQSGLRQTERNAKVLSFLQSGGVVLLWRPGAISKLCHSRAGKGSNSYGICAFRAGMGGTSENSASQLGHTRLEAERRRKTRPERRVQDRLSH